MPRRARARHVKAAVCAALIAIVAPLEVATAASSPTKPAVTQGAGEDAIPRPAQRTGEEPSTQFMHALPGSGSLQLEVTINSLPANKIVGFKDIGGGRLASTRRDLEEIGVRAPGGGPPDQVVELDSIPNLEYYYDVPAQRIDLTAADEARIRREYDARGENGERDPARADYGAVLNYSLFAVSTSDADNIDVPEDSSINASLDGRLITPFGVLSQTGVVGQRSSGIIGLDAANVLRLETTLTHADEEHMIMYRAGDVISNGPYWSRPVRLGGLQVQRSFLLRPGLVTQSLPSYSGSAAVPSTVDIYVNNAKAYSKQVDSGPYQINNIPAVSGAGIARVVVRDAAGHETEQNLSFYSSPQLLRPGLTDFSIESGAARHDFGLLSGNYGDEMLASGSLKTGLFENLTVEAHSEIGGGLVNAGAGVILRAGDLGVVSVAASASTHDGDDGVQIYGSLDTKLGPVMINLRSQHGFNDYKDLASITAIAQRTPLPGIITPGGFLSVAPPRAVDTIGFSIPIEFDNSSFGVNFVHYETFEGDVSNLVTATYSRPLFDNATMFATGYVDLEDRDTFAVYAGVNVALDNGISINGGVERRSSHTSATIEASKSLPQQADSWGWRVQDREGGDVQRSAELSYRASSARVSGGVRQHRQGLRGTVEVEGAVAALGGGVFTSNRIEDAFAVVDAGSPGIRVMRENNYIGDTGSDGKILVPNMNSYQRNKLEIDPMGLPLNAEVTETYSNVTPAFHSGIYVDFQVKRDTPSALIILTDEAGQFLPAGAEVTLDGSSDVFMVGYDGQTFVTGLADNNTLIVKSNETTCQISFAFKPDSNTQTTIGPEVCR